MSRSLSTLKCNRRKKQKTRNKKQTKNKKPRLYGHIKSIPTKHTDWIWWYTHGVLRDTKVWNSFYRQIFPSSYSFPDVIQESTKKPQQWFSNTPIFVYATGDGTNELLSVSVHRHLLVPTFQTEHCLRYSEEIHRNGHGPCLMKFTI